MFGSLYIFLLPPLFFRFSNQHLDKIWMISSAITLGGVIPLVSERFFFGGVQDSFYFAGPLMYLCPTCASPHFASYAWTPADFLFTLASAPRCNDGIVLSAPQTEIRSQA